MCGLDGAQLSSASIEQWLVILSMGIIIKYMYCTVVPVGLGIDEEG